MSYNLPMSVMRFSMAVWVTVRVRSLSRTLFHGTHSYHRIWYPSVNDKDSGVEELLSLDDGVFFFLFCRRCQKFSWMPFILLFFCSVPYSNILPSHENLVKMQQQAFLAIGANVPQWVRIEAFEAFYRETLVLISAESLFRLRLLQEHLQIGFESFRRTKKSSCFTFLPAVTFTDWKNEATNQFISRNQVNFNSCQFETLQIENLNSTKIALFIKGGECILTLRRTFAPNSQNACCCIFTSFGRGKRFHTVRWNSDSADRPPTANRQRTSKSPHIDTATMCQQ